MVDVVEYWRAKEEILGERIIDKFFCNYLGGHPNINGPSCGVLYFSESKFCFQSFTAQGGLADKFRFGNQSQGKEGEAFCYPLKELACEVEPSNYSFWDKLFSHPEKILVVSRKTGEGETFSCCFKLSPDEAKIILKYFND